MRSIVIVLAVVVSSCAGVQLPKASLVDPGALLFNGYVHEKVDCWECHNGDGNGSGRGPGLALRVPKRSDERLAQVIRDGKGRMPGFKDELSEAEVAQLVSWLRAAFPHAGP
ncbi:MAG: cytochrome c [Myxococcota bacterium]